MSDCKGTRGRLRLVRPASCAGARGLLRREGCSPTRLPEPHGLAAVVHPGADIDPVKRVARVSDVALVLSAAGVERVEVEQDVARPVGVEGPKPRRITVPAG